MRKKKLAVKIFWTVIIGAISIVFLLPLIWMVSSSLKPVYSIYDFPIEWIPKKPLVQNYVEVWTDPKLPFGRLYLNSLKISAITIVFKLLVSSAAAYAFAKMRFPGKNVIFMLFMATMMIPGQVTIIPRFIFFKELGLYNTHTALILPALFSVSSIFMLRSFYVGIPNDLSESAVIDGASHLRIWLQIIMPLSTAPMATLAILALVSSWNDYFDPLIFLTDYKKFTVSLGVKKLAGDTHINLGLAASVSAILPILILYVFCQKYFVQSIASSGIKG